MMRFCFVQQSASVGCGCGSGGGDLVQLEEESINLGSQR